jgi:hypothetical protein
MNTTPLQSVSGLSSLERPRYSPGSLLEAEDLTSAVDYTRDVVRLLIRSLFGCGVICGLTVGTEDIKANELKVTVSDGLAVDGAGNLIQVGKQQELTFDCVEADKVYLVVVCHTEKACRYREAACADDDSPQMVSTRMHEGFEIRIFPAESAPSGMCTRKDGIDTDIGKFLANTDCNSDRSFDGNTGCACNCVLLAELRIKNNGSLKCTPDTSKRRDIRPMLATLLSSQQRTTT